MNKETFQQYIPKNAAAVFYDNIAAFKVSVSDIKDLIYALRNEKNLPLKLITATDERKERGCFKIWYIFGVPKENIFLIPYIELNGATEFPSISLLCPEALNYERKIQTFFGLTPVGNPDPRPIILHENWPKDVFPLRKDVDLSEKPKDANGAYLFHQVKGEEIYEIPVGPIHAGIIEPGHFRFSVAGETIMFLESRLGFTHKGSEKLFEYLPLSDMARLAEKISGDSSFSHSLAFCQAAEKLSGKEPPERARYLRVIYAELERLANHIGDIGAIMLDAGFNFGGAQGARLREMIMRVNERLTGSRFLRGVNVIGGVKKDISKEEIKKLSDDLNMIAKDFSEVIAISKDSSSLINRLYNTGKLAYAVAKDYGVVGIAAKAVGLRKDARADFPYAAYGELFRDEIETEQEGDVFARFRVRVKEAASSMRIIERAARGIPEGPIAVSSGITAFKKNACSIGIVEGWRGEILYFITTDMNGNIARVAPRDPSFLNWTVLGKVIVNNVVPDFPLINKSFNLSYSGNDL